MDGNVSFSGGDMPPAPETGRMTEPPDASDTADDGGQAADDLAAAADMGFGVRQA